MAVMRASPSTQRQRLLAAVSVAALHAAMGFALISGFGVTSIQAANDNLKAFDVEVVAPEPAPAPAPVEPQTTYREPRTAKPEAPAVPANLRQTPSPVVVPPPTVPLPVPSPIPVATLQGEGLRSEAGAADVHGPGTGSGGNAAGTGSGVDGNGTGGGGVAVHAERIKGRIKSSDYPKGAYEAHAGGTVFVRLVVGADGRVNDCTIDESSGRPDLDAATCQIILDRYRYRPARDASGNPIPEIVHMAQVWKTGRRW